METPVKMPTKSVSGSLYIVNPIWSIDLYELISAKMNTKMNQPITKMGNVSPLTDHIYQDTQLVIFQC